MSGTRSIESRQLCRAVPDAVTELGPEEAWRLNDAYPHVVYAHPGTVGAAARLPEAPGSQKRLGEDLSFVRGMRASMPAAIVATPISAVSDYVDRIVDGRRQLSQIASQTDCALYEQEGL